MNEWVEGRWDEWDEWDGMSDGQTANSNSNSTQ